eukprot:TRINITY_DN16104_c0_g1_i1.p1 TRINITY_DN16104_c0_g1~~TRINITY_DN16104_c0_g1_i1.p1  ORF type:complete len:219 (+),score=12.86 TRINITY_DN16104_c0_g1_i1:315-971(+)
MHSNLMPVLAYCAEFDKRAVVVPYQVPANTLATFPLARRIKAMVGLTKLLVNITDKFVLCDLRQDQFGFSTAGEYTYQDLDMIFMLPGSSAFMHTPLELHPKPMGGFCRRGQSIATHCAGQPCRKGGKCGYTCLFGVKHDPIFEHRCETSDHRCPGVTSRSMVYVLARRFLQYFLRDLLATNVRLQAIVGRCLEHHPAKRPTAAEVLDVLQHLQHNTK